MARLTYRGRVTDSDALRIGTAEREAAVRFLGDHMSEGRLSLEEYEERTSASLEARTRGELKSLFKDLPAPYPPFMTPPPVPYSAAAPAAYASAPPPALTNESDRYRVAAGVLQIVLPFGIGRFYTGHTNIGLAQLLTSFMLVGIIWSFIDGIIILAGGGTDVDGRKLRD